MTKKDRGYVRVSTLKESQKDSPEHQEAFIRETARREGIEIEHFYEDRDTATTIIDRTDVKRMIEDAKRGEIRSIWFASLSRFSRDMIDAVSLKRILVNALKIRVVSIEDGYDSKVKDDELLFGIKSVVNQNTSGDISISSRRGIRQSALEKGNYIGSIPAYGYSKVTIDGRKTLERREEQAVIVEMMYNLYIDEGMGDKAIVNYLNGDNPTMTIYPSYNGQPWSLTVVQRILTNPTYTGYNVHGRFSTEVVYDDIYDLMKRRKKLVANPPEKWEWSKEPTHPIIVPLDRWKTAQAIRLQRSGGRRGGKRTFVNVFAKLIYCAECGSAMVTMLSRTREKDYRYLMCSRRRRVGEAGCANGKWIPYYEMRDELINEILRRIRNSLKAMESKGASEISLGLPRNNFEKEKQKLTKRLANSRKLLFEIRKQHLLEEIDYDQYEFEKEQYEKEIQEAEHRLVVIKAEEKKIIDIERLVQESKAALRELTKLENYDDIEKTRQLLAKAVQRIEANKDGEIAIHTFI